MLRDEALGSAWRRVLRRWRPLAGWTVLVWALVGLALGPASSALLGWQVLRGPRAVVANEALLVWLVTPRGIAWSVLAGALALVGAVGRYAGLSHIATDDLEGRRPTVRRTALHLVPQLPALFRLSLVAAGIRAARIEGMELHVWTVNRAPVMAELIERGVDGLITDDPALAVRVRDEMRAPSTPSRLLLRVSPGRWDPGDPAPPMLR
jgi:hypothetical protein